MHTLKQSADHRNQLIDSKLRSTKIKELKDLRDLAILTEEEFKMKVRRNWNVI
jgi:hypothetical protein